MGAMTLAASAVRRCPDSSLLASHWRQDGTCAHEPPSLALLVGESKKQRLALQIDVYPGSEVGYVKPSVTIRFDSLQFIPRRTVRAWTWLQGRRR